MEVLLPISFNFKDVMLCAKMCAPDTGSRGDFLLVDVLGGSSWS